MAEGTGFEPAVALRRHLFSRQAHSTTLPPLRGDADVRPRVNSNHSRGILEMTISTISSEIENYEIVIHSG